MAEFWELTIPVRCDNCINNVIKLFYDPVNPDNSYIKCKKCNCSRKTAEGEARELNDLFIQYIMNSNRYRLIGKAYTY